LYAWCLDAPAKAGATPTSRDSTGCFGPLLGWVVRRWSTEQIAVTLDATRLRDRFVVRAIWVV